MVSLVAGVCVAVGAMGGADLDARHAAATIEAAAFLAGDWSAERDGGFTQEVWSAPMGDNIMGMFRWVGEDGSAALFELLTITEEDGTLVLRLRHQDALGRTWEPVDLPMTLHLVSHEGRDSGGLLRFEDTSESCDLAACQYEIRGGALHLDVEFDDEGRETLVFELERAGA